MRGNTWARRVGLAAVTGIMIGGLATSKALAFFPPPAGNVGGVTVIDPPPVEPPAPNPTIPPLPTDPFEPPPSPTIPTTPNTPDTPTPPLAATPEPTSIVLGLTGVGLAGLAMIRRRRK